MEIPKPLLDDILTDKCLPFIGAGLSLNASLPKGYKMPDWSKLTKILAKTAQVSPKIGNLRVASEYERKFGRVQLIEEIRRALFIDEVKPGKAHKIFAELSFDTIYTTNFDLLLEDSLSLIQKPYRSLVGELQMPFHGGRLTTNIVKMHGDMRHEEHIIVTEEDYHNYLQNYPVIATHLSAMLITRTPLFIGYSLSDPDFKNIREIVRSRLGKFERMAYLIQFKTSSSKDEKSLLDRNLHVIPIEVVRGKSKDSQLADFFKVLQESLDIQEGERFRISRPFTFEEVPKETLSATFKATDASVLLTSSSNLCFTMMPIRPEYDTIYRLLIIPVVEQFGMTHLRADEILTPGLIMEQIRTAILQSRLCIADISENNPNVLYELGIAQSIGKPVVILSRDIDRAPFDVKNIRIIQYNPDSLESARLSLEEMIQQVLGEDRLDEAGRLIENGMYRAAVAMLGVLLEHSFRQLNIKYLGDLPRQSSRRPLAMRQSLQFLIDSEVINKEDGLKLFESIKIRNQAVHELEEPQAKDAKLMLQIVTDFIRKYIQLN